MTDPIEEFKAKQRETWSLGNFAEVAIFTAVPAGHLVRFAGIRPGQRVLDVACGTGVVSITAARHGGIVTGLDLTPALLDQARATAPVAGFPDIVWREGDAESLPFGDASFDVVLSQFGHIFAPRPEVATREMLRVLKPGGRIALATWPPEMFPGCATALIAKYVPPPAGVPSPMEWGDPAVVRDRLGGAVRDLAFERGTMPVPALSPKHYLAWQLAKVGPYIKTMGALQKEPAKLEAYQRESAELIASVMTDNVVRNDYLLSRAIKV